MTLHLVRIVGSARPRHLLRSAAATQFFAALPFLLRRTGNWRSSALVSFQTLADCFPDRHLRVLAASASPFLPWLLVSLMSGLFYHVSAPQPHPRRSLRATLQSSS